MWKTFLKLDTFSRHYSMWSQLDTIALTVLLNIVLHLKKGRYLSEGSTGQNVREAGCLSILLISRTYKHTLKLALCHCCTGGL